jgi:hypothetical protein
MMASTSNWLRSPVTVRLIAAALIMSLVLASAYVWLEHRASSAASRRDHPAQPLTNDQAEAQVLQSAQQIVAAAQLGGTSGGLAFVSCTNDHDPPYQPLIYMNFQLPQINSFKYLQDLASVMTAQGWRESPAPSEHFGKQFTKDGVTSIFSRNTDNLNFATMRLYGECRVLADHRNDNPMWTDVADRLTAHR